MRIVFPLSLSLHEEIYNTTQLPVVHLFINSVAMNDSDTWSCGLRGIAGLHVGCIIFEAQSSEELPVK